MAATKTPTDLIVDLLKSESFDGADFARIAQAYKFAQTKKSAAAARAFKQGDRVEFRDKLGRIKTGVVTKVNTKTIKVFSDDNVNWTVSPGLLSLSTKKVA